MTESTDRSAYLTVMLNLADSPTWLPFHAYDSGDRVEVSVIGEADICTARQLRAVLTRVVCGQPASVRVDLTAMSFCDSRGLDALHDAEHLAAAVHVTMTWAGASPLVAWMHATFPRAARGQRSAEVGATGPRQIQPR